MVFVVTFFRKENDGKKLSRDRKVREEGLRKEEGRAISLGKSRVSFRNTGT